LDTHTAGGIREALDAVRALAKPAGAAAPENPDPRERAG